ncbi:MAG: hypothetical protein AAB573_00375 [Patescibacteria group bacterium]
MSFKAKNGLLRRTWREWGTKADSKSPKKARDTVGGWATGIGGLAVFLIP